MRIQLIHPPLYLNVRAMTALRPSLPLGLAYVAASLRRAGHEISLLDAVGEAPGQITLDGELQRLGLTPEEIVERLDPEAEAFGLTNMWSFSWPLVREIIHRIKERYPDTPLVCGGEHFTGMTELSLKAAPIDYLVAGEGEDVAAALFAALERGEPTDAIPGVFVLRDGEVVSAGRGERRRDLDELPRPAWDLLDVEAYDEHGFVCGVRAGMTIPILATRGCPYRCTYCSSERMWTTRYYVRDPEDVADEIADYYERYGARNFPFQDLTAIIKRDWVLEFCRALLARDLGGITWQFPSGTRCEVIDDEVAELLARTGGRSLAYAPESGSERTRKLIGKQMKTESLLNAVRASVRHGLNITCFFVLGFPHDREEDFPDTTKLVRKLARMGIDDIAIGFFFPIPNTPLCDELVERGIVDLEDDEFLLTPIHANESKLIEQNNYCDRVSARRLTFWKYRLLANFYGVSFLCRPWRVLQIVLNTIRGKETRKLETYLVEKRRQRRVEKERDKQAG
jgi:anaerobic magnesium-protoporphyrin IX monomethyl ester cyclase